MTKFILGLALAFSGLAGATSVIQNGQVTGAKLNSTVFFDLTTATPVAADYVPISDSSASNAKKKATVASFRNAVYRAVSSYPDAVGVDDETMKLSGSSGTLTIPTAVSVEGKRYKFIHAGTSLTQVYTLGTTSSQTIGGIAGGSYALYTAGEVLEIESDGANWIIVNHYAKTAISGSTTISVQAISGGTVKGTNTADSIVWSRDGQFATVILNYVQTGAGTAGTGNYLFTLPTGLTFDNTYHPYFTTAIAQNAIGKLTDRIGYGYASYGAVTNGASLVPVAYDSTNFRLWTIDSTSPGTVDGASNYGIAGANANYHVTLRFAVPGWRP